MQGLEEQIDKKIPAQQHGVLVLNKPQGPSSAACVGLIKRKCGQKKIGHAGTLDPMASGVLLLLLGQATKISGLLLGGGEKIYSGILKLGVSTDTWDAEGNIVAEASQENVEAVTQEALREVIDSWLGESEQTVPPYSAAKHQGKPLYELARKGLETPVKTKTVKISRAELEWFKPPLARFRVTCSSGTYIRSLAHSLGVRMGCGATLMELTREYSHPFGIDQAVGLDDLLNNPALVEERVWLLQDALPHLPVITLDAASSAKVKYGTALPAVNFPPIEGTEALFLDETGAPLALVSKKIQGKELVWAIGRGLWNS